MPEIDGLTSPRCGPQEPCPFTKVAAEAQITGFLPTEPSRCFVPLAAFSIGPVLVATRRNENVRSERIVSCSARSSG